MLQFNNYDKETRAHIRKRLSDCAETLGGTGRLLSLVETILGEKPSPLQNKTASFHYADGKVGWNKVIYADKVETLQQIIRRYDTMENLFKIASKKELNAVKTLFPVTVTIAPKEGAPCELKIIEADNAETARINPLFELLFFASTGLIKKVLKEM